MAKVFLCQWDRAVGIQFQIDRFVGEHEVADHEHHSENQPFVVFALATIVVLHPTALGHWPVVKSWSVTTGFVGGAVMGGTTPGTGHRQWQGGICPGPTEQRAARTYQMAYD